LDITNPAKNAMAVGSMATKAMVTKGMVTKGMENGPPAAIGEAVSAT
jgi:hypothetical protein